jgi:hypothetical protein
MDSSLIRSSAGTTLILGAVVLVGCLAGSGAVTAWGDLAPADKPGRAGAALTFDGCHYCGVVEQVREVKSRAPRYGISTVAGGRDEMIVMFLSALTGASVTFDQKKLYEVSVRMDNGAIRAVRGSRLPDWKLGDRVKVVKGRVEPLS